MRRKMNYSTFVIFSLGSLAAVFLVDSAFQYVENKGKSGFFLGVIGYLLYLITLFLMLILNKEIYDQIVLKSEILISIVLVTWPGIVILLNLTSMVSKARKRSEQLNGFTIKN